MSINSLTDDIQPLSVISTVNDTVITQQIIETKVNNTKLKVTSDTNNLVILGIDNSEEESS